MLREAGHLVRGTLGLPKAPAEPRRSCIFILKNYSGTQMINIGVGKDISIAEFADMLPTSSTTAAKLR